MVVEIIFSGLIAFVRGSCEVKKAETIQAVMVKDKAKLHEPKLVVAVRDVLFDQSDVAWDDLLAAPNGTQYAVWYLGKKQIEVVGAKPIQIKEGKRDYAEPLPGASGAAMNPPNDFSWIPELNRACWLPASTGQIENDRHANKYAKDHADTWRSVARMKTLQVEPTNGDPTENFLEAVEDTYVEDDIVEFEGLEQPYRQVMGDSARLKLTIDQDKIEIRLSKLGSGSFQTIRLKPHVAGDPVRIAISNLPPPNMSAMKYPHFRDYYRLLNYKKSKNCPMPMTKHTHGASKKKEMWGIQPIKCALCSTCN